MKQKKTLGVFSLLIIASLICNSCNKSNNPANPNTTGITYDCTTFENITTNTTLAAGNYNITCNILVSNYAILTIAPGATLNFSQGISLTAELGATINASGTAAQPIVFKGNGTKGYWNGITLNNLYSAVSNNNIFSYCTITDGGGNYFNLQDYGANITMANATSAFTNCTISNSNDVGIYMTGAAPDATVFTAFNNNTLSGNGTYPLRVNAAGAASLGSATGNRYSNNTFNYIGLEQENNGGGYDVNVDITLKPQPVPYLLIDGTNGIMFNKSFMIAPGTNIIMGSGTSLLITSTGSIDARGTSTSPIVINGYQATAGYWGSIFVESNSALNTLSYCKISGGGGAEGLVYGYGAPYYGLISTYQWAYNNESVNVTNCTLSNSASSGIYVHPTSGTNLTYNNDISTANYFSSCNPNVYF